MDDLQILGELSGFEAVDFRLGALLASYSKHSSVLVCFSAMLVSRATRQGNVCLELTRYANLGFADAALSAGTGELDATASGTSQPLLTLPNCERWQALLLASGVVGPKGAQSPLILIGERLYLQRYHDHEMNLARNIASRLGKARTFAEPSVARQAIERWFAGTSENARRAAEIAISSRVCVLIGGPGTGKTSAVVRLVGVLSELATLNGRDPPRVMLLAPTGKAAARLTESILTTRMWLASEMPEVTKLPFEAMTLHRALGALERSQNGNSLPLYADLVIVDEASMVDLAMMRRLFEAAQTVERLVILGDPNQLASVEAGAVLGDICAEEAGLRAPRVEVPGHLQVSDGIEVRGFDGAPLQTVVVELLESHRFKGNSAIGLLSKSILLGDVSQTMELLAGDDATVRFEEVAEKQVGRAVQNEIWLGYQPLRQAASVEEALQALGRYRVLCVHRRGKFGVETWNQQILRLCEREERASKPGVGACPILITENAEDGTLFNGDLGVLLSGSQEGSARAHLRSTSGKLVSLGTGRLPSYEFAFAMSVHKSQGSEVDEVLILLPEATSPLLTRELLYTAVTRAKARCVIVGSKDALRRCILTKVQRQSGLSAEIRQCVLRAHEEA